MRTAVIVTTTTVVVLGGLVGAGIAVVAAITPSDESIQVVGVQPIVFEPTPDAAVPDAVAVLAPVVPPAPTQPGEEEQTVDATAQPTTPPVARDPVVAAAPAAPAAAAAATAAAAVPVAPVTSAQPAAPATPETVRPERPHPLGGYGDHYGLSGSWGTGDAGPCSTTPQPSADARGRGSH